MHPKSFNEAFLTACNALLFNRKAARLYFFLDISCLKGVDDIVSLCMLLPCLWETGGAGLPRTAAILILVILAQVDLLAVVQLGVKADVLAGEEHGLDDLIAVVRAPAALGGDTWW